MQVKPDPAGWRVELDVNTSVVFAKLADARDFLDLVESGSPAGCQAYQAALASQAAQIKEAETPVVIGYWDGQVQWSDGTTTPECAPWRHDGD